MFDSINGFYIVEPYDYYDGLLFYLGRNKDKFAFVLCVDPSENMWLHVYCSPEKIYRVKNNQIDIRTAFLEHEDERDLGIFPLWMHRNGGTFPFDRRDAIEVGKLVRELLPDRGVYLGLNPDEQ